MNRQGLVFLHRIMMGLALALGLAVAAVAVILKRRQIALKQVWAWMRTHARNLALGAGAVTLVALGGYLSVDTLFAYMDSVQFCGTTCHANRAEYVVHQRSAHARVRCTRCHVGPGLGRELQAKLNGSLELWQEVTNTYGRPIALPVESMPPAEQSCERCHWAGAFQSERATTLPRFANDEANTRTGIALKMNVGDDREEGGVHWHIGGRVTYIATDPQRQIIPWVRAEIGGESIEFVDADNPLDEEALAQYEVRVMDCIDCHNRTAHDYQTTDAMLDEALASGVLPGDLPYLRREAWNAMERSASHDAALAALAAIPDFYRENYPEIYAERQETLRAAVAALQAMYRAANVPAMNLDASTYPDNRAHSEAPGCFRCHDSQHHAVHDSERAIPLQCDTCHSLPQTVAAPPPSEPQPESHGASTWMSDHRYIYDATCDDCHGEPGFCANPNCHGRAWPYVDLSATSPPFPLLEP